MEESIIVPIYEKGDKTDYSNYGGILESNSQIKNIRDLYRGISDLKKGYQLDLI